MSQAISRCLGFLSCKTGVIRYPPNRAVVKMGRMRSYAEHCKGCPGVFVKTGVGGTSLMVGLRAAGTHPCSLQAPPLGLPPPPAAPRPSPPMSLCDGASSLLPCECLPSLRGRSSDGREPLTGPLAGPATPLRLPLLPPLPAVSSPPGPLGLPTEGAPAAPGRKGRGGGARRLESWRP